LKNRAGMGWECELFSFFFFFSRRPALCPRHLLSRRAVRMLPAFSLSLSLSLPPSLTLPRAHHRDAAVENLGHLEPLQRLRVGPQAQRVKAIVAGQGAVQVGGRRVAREPEGAVGFRGGGRADGGLKGDGVVRVRLRRKKRVREKGRVSGGAALSLPRLRLRVSAHATRPANAAQSCVSSAWFDPPQGKEMGERVRGWARMRDTPSSAAAAVLLSSFAPARAPLAPP